MANRTHTTGTNRTRAGGTRADDGGPARDERSVGDLVRRLADDGTRLVRQEVQLAKAEMRETAQVYERNAMKLAAGGLFLAGALFMAYVAANRGLTALLEGAMPIETALWVSPLALALLSALVGWAVVSHARKKMDERSIAPERALDTARDEANWIKHEAKEMRSG